MNIPKFNTPSNPGEWLQHVSGFRVEIIRCTKKDNLMLSIPPILNIMHLSRDLESSRGEIDRIRVFLEVSGYDVRITKPSETNEADLIFIGMDRKDYKDVKYIIDTISSGFLGLYPRTDMLVYSPLFDRQSPYVTPDGPILLGPEFHAYGMCLLHEYIRASLDSGIRCGRHVSMLMDIERLLQEELIDKLGEKTKGTAYKKITKFRELLEARGHMNVDGRFAFTALDILYHTRNYLVHDPPFERDKDELDKAIHKMNELAFKHDRVLEMPAPSGMQEPYSQQKRWTTRLAMITQNWIRHYLEDNPVTDNDRRVVK